MSMLVYCWPTVCDAVPTSIGSTSPHCCEVDLPVFIYTLDPHLFCDACDLSDVHSVVDGTTDLSHCLSVYTRSCMLLLYIHRSLLESIRLCVVLFKRGGGGVKFRLLTKLKSMIIVDKIPIMYSIKGHCDLFCKHV